jgi:hypothetical protein
MNQHLKEKGIKLTAPPPGLPLGTFPSGEGGFQPLRNSVRKKTYSFFRCHQANRLPIKFKHKQEILKSLFKKIIIFMNKKQMI